MTKLHPILTTISSHLKVKKSFLILLFTLSLYLSTIQTIIVKDGVKSFRLELDFFHSLYRKNVMCGDVQFYEISVELLPLWPLREQRLWNGRDSFIVGENFLLTIVSEPGQTHQQSGRKLRVEVFLSVTIFCKHFDMVSKLMRYKNARVVFNFPSSLHKVVSNSKYRVQSILCTKTFV